MKKKESPSNMNLLRQEQSMKYVFIMTEGVKYLERAWLSVDLPTISKVVQLYSGEVARERARAQLI